MRPFWSAYAATFPMKGTSADFPNEVVRMTHGLLIQMAGVVGYTSGGLVVSRGA